jgi:hypothetical protein
MRRVLPASLAALLPLLLVVGCDGGFGLPPGPADLAPAPQVRVSFPPGGLADTIVVEAIDRLPLRAAELIAPGGSITRAAGIDTDSSPRFASGQRVAADPWRSTLSGSSGPTASMTQNAGAGAAYQSQQQLLATVSSADIPLPDPVAYRRDWAHYRIRLTFGTPPDAETREFAAPQPPR